LSETPTERRQRMDKQMLESRLKLYKQHKAEVDTTLKRIDVWKEMLDKGELEYFEYVPGTLPGMPKSTTVTSPIEIIVSRHEVTREMVEQWIDDDESRIRYKKLEVEQIGIALAALTAEQRAVIESKYLEGMTWRNIEIIFNEKFSRNRVYVTEEGLQKINNSSLEILWEILGPLYSKYLYFRQYNVDIRKSTRKVPEKYRKSTSLPIGKEI
jgi:hypothetical protein